MNIEVRIPKKVYLPVYQHLLNSDADINFLWGGRDSGKSFFVAQKMITDCLSLKQFRCVLVRKTYASIHDSQYQMLKDVVEDWGLQRLFKFTKDPLRIQCVNGNSFIARGCDNPGMVKSITNPTHAWFEEGNQLSLDDYTIVSSTLRGRRFSSKIQQWFSFNPEAPGSYEDFWIYKNYISAKEGQNIYENYTNKVEVEIKVKGVAKIVPITYSSTHTTYDDNPYCPDQRRALLELWEKINPHYYNVFTLGKWGNKANESPFAYAWDGEKHLGVVTRVLGLPLYVSFDFNRNPICASVYQIINGTKIRGLEVIKLDNSDIYKLCAYLNKHYPAALWIVTGDASGAASTAMVEDGLNYYKIIKTQLRLSATQMKVPLKNPKIEDNQVIVNAVLALLDVKFDSMKCKAMKFDMENVAMLPDGTIDKSNRKNESMQADAMDTFRYLCNTFFKKMILKMIPGDKNEKAA